MCAGILDDSPVECNKHVAVELFKFSEDLKRFFLGERGVIRMKCLCSLSPQWRGGNFDFDGCGPGSGRESKN